MYIHNIDADISSNLTLWRYMSFEKFCDLLDRSALYFCRMNQFEDKAEGTQPLASLDFAYQTENPWQIVERMYTDEVLRMMRSYTYISCWRASQRQSNRMWKEYVGSADGIAIKTTFRDLTDSILDKQQIAAGKVKYIDFDTTFMDYFMANPYDFIIIKEAKKYHHERELRLFTVEDEYPSIDPDEAPYGKTDYDKNRPSGKHIKVDLQKLIHLIYPKPGSNTAFIATLSDTLAGFELLHTLRAIPPV